MTDSPRPALEDRSGMLLLSGLALVFPLLYLPQFPNASAPRFALLLALSPGLLLAALSGPGSLASLRRRPFCWLAGALLCWSALSGLWAIQPIFTLQSVAMLAAGLGSCALAYTLGSRPDRRQLLLWCIFIAGLVVALLSVAQAHPAMRGFGQGRSATIGHWNFMASFLIGVSAAAAALAVGAPHRAQRLVALAGLPLFAIVILRTGSRGGMLGLAGAFAVALALLPLAIGDAGRRRKTLAALLACGLLLLAGLFAVPRLRGRLTSVFNPRSPTIALRLSMYRSSWRMAWARPLTGWGHGNYLLAFPQHREPRLTWIPEVQLNIPNPLMTGVYHAHNEYLELAAEVGFTGLLLFIALLACVVRAVFGALRRGPPEAPMIVALASGWAGLLTHGLVSPALRFPVVAVLFWTLTGLLLACCHPALFNADVARAPGARWRGPLVLLLTVLSGLLSLRPCVADWRMGEVRRAASIEIPALRLALCRQAVSWNPYEPRVYPALFSLTLQTGELDAARAVLAEVDRRVPGFYPVDVWRARLALAENRLDVAEGAMQSAVLRAPRFSPWLLLHGRCLELQDRLAPAANRLRAAWTYQSNIAQSAHALERICYARKQPQRGLHWFLTAARSGTSGSAMPGGGGLHLSRQQGLREMIAQLESRGDLREARAELGMLRHWQGHPAQARNLWRSALPGAVGRQQAELHFALAVSEQSKAELAAALAADPEHINARLLQILWNETSSEVDTRLDSLIADCRALLGKRIEGPAVSDPPELSLSFETRAVFCWALYLRAVRSSLGSKPGARGEGKTAKSFFWPSQIGYGQMLRFQKNWRETTRFSALRKELETAWKPGWLRVFLR